MKKLLVFLALLPLFHSVKAQEDQSFYKHALIASVGFGGDAYAITETYTLNGTGITSTTTGSAACRSYPILAEYGVGKWLGLGLSIKFDSYIIKKDSANNYQPTANGTEFGALVNFHFVRSKHVDMFAGLDLGGSHFVYTLDKFNDQVYGTGSWADIHIDLRYYFGRFGLFGSLAFPTMKYNLTGNNSNWSLGQNILSTWVAKGGAFHLGLQYRFFNPAN